MPALYNVLLLVHILAVVTWVGSVLTIGGLTALLVARREHADLARMLRTSMVYGAAVAGPSAVVTLLAGMGMMGVARLEPQLWMLLGFASIVLSIGLGVGFTRRTLPEVIRLAADPAADARLRASSERRLNLLNGINALLLVSAIAAMVLKPTF